MSNQVLIEHIIKDVNESQFFSVIADKSCDISGIEQLSLGIRFVHKMSTGEFCVREEFLGFSPLQCLDAETISEQILSTLLSLTYQKWSVKHMTAVLL